MAALPSKFFREKFRSISHRSIHHTKVLNTKGREQEQSFIGLDFLVVSFLEQKISYTQEFPLEKEDIAAFAKSVNGGR